MVGMLGGENRGAEQTKMEDHEENAMGSREREKREKGERRVEERQRYGWPEEAERKGAIRTREREREKRERGKHWKTSWLVPLSIWGLLAHSAMAHEAAMAGDVLSLEAYLSARGDPNAVSESMQGRTVLHCAAYSGSVACVEALLRYKSIDLNRRDRLGLSPLQCACTLGFDQLSWWWYDDQKVEIES